VRINDSEVNLIIDLVGKNPCANQSLVPAIDAHVKLFFRQVCDQTVGLGTMEFRVEGWYNGFPWHEMYLNRVEVFRHDPCITGDTPNSLFDFLSKILYQEFIPDPNDGDGFGDGRPLGEWHDVPGFN